MGRSWGAELGSLEEVGAAFAEPSLAVSSLGSWADECERADTALAAAEAQMGLGCPDESMGADTATAGDLLEEDDWDWLTNGQRGPSTVNDRAGSGRCAAAASARGTQGSAAGPARGPQASSRATDGQGGPAEPGGGAKEGGNSPRAGVTATQGAATGRKPRRPSSPRGPEEDKVQMVKVQKRGRGQATVEAKWETLAAPLSGRELRKLMEATAEADWPQDVRVALGKKVA